MEKLKTEEVLVAENSKQSFNDFDFRFSQVQSLIVKVTNRCNLDCAYCYENVSRTGQDMSIQIFKSIVDRTYTSTTAKNVHFIFHGGEPTLLKDEWYLEAVSYASNVAANFQKTASFGLQTNLTALTEEKISLFKFLNIRPGVSIDDPTLTLKSLRQKSESKVVRNFLRLKESGVKFGLLVTINESNYSNFPSILKWLEENNVMSFKANVVYPVGHGQKNAPLTPDKIYQAQEDILKYMIETNGKLVIEDNTVQTIKRFFDTQRRQSLCHDKTCGAGSRVIGLTTDGNMLPCGRFQWNDQEHLLGKAAENNEQEYFAKLNHFLSSAESNWVDCNECEAKKICSFGCQAFIVRSQQQVNIECTPTKRQYAYLLQNEANLKSVYESLISRLARKKSDSLANSYRDYFDSDTYADYSDSDAGGGGAESDPKRTSMTASGYVNSYRDYFDSETYADYSDEGDGGGGAESDPK
jgi:uncharacterized protein